MNDSDVSDLYETSNSTASPTPIAMANIMTGVALARVLSNGLIVLALFRLTALRTSKEHLLMAYMALYDCLDGALFVSMFVNRGTERRKYCLMTIQNILFLFTPQSASFMLVMVSVDRILGVGLPFWYYRQTYRLGHKLGLFPLLWSGFVASFVLSEGIGSDPNQMVPHCVPLEVFGKRAFMVVNLTRQLHLINSVLLYALVPVVYMATTLKRMRRIEVEERSRSAEWQGFLNMQKKVTKTFGISAFATFCLYVLPYSMTSAIALHRKIPSPAMRFATTIMINTSSILNIFLFTGRHKEVNLAIVAMLRCKRMPHRLLDWPDSNTAAPPSNRASGGIEQSKT